MFDGASVPVDKDGEKWLDMSVKHNFLITEWAVNVVADSATPYGYIEDLKEKLGELHVAKVSYVAK